MSDEQPGGWPRPQDEPVPTGWAPQQPPADGPAYGGQRDSGAPPADGAPRSWQQPGPAPRPDWGGPAGSQHTAPVAPKPGIIPLRPLGVGEILDGAIAAMRRHWRIMLGLSAVVAALTQVVSVPLKWLLLHDAIDTSVRTSPSGDPGGDVTVLAGALTSAAIEGLITALAVLVLSGILTAAVSRAVLGEPISAREAWDRARPRIPTLLGVTGLMILIFLGLTLACLAPGVLLAVGGAPTALVALAFVAGAPALLVAVVYLYTAFALAPPAVVLERQSVVGSLRRSRALVKGAWWRTFGILLLVNVIAQVLSGILLTPFQLLSYFVAFLGGDDTNIYALVPLLITALGTILAATVTWPFTAVATALLYVDRRMRREALDLELARVVGAAAAPGAAPVDPPMPRP